MGLGIVGLKLLVFFSGMLDIMYDIIKKKEKGKVCLSIRKYESLFME